MSVACFLIAHPKGTLMWDAGAVPDSSFKPDGTHAPLRYATATWLVRKLEREIMFTDPPSPRTEPANYSALKNTKTVIVTKDEYDVFDDGTVILKSTPGH